MIDWSIFYNGFRDPMVEIKVAGQTIKNQDMDIISVYVEKSVGCEASTCEIKLKSDRARGKDIIPKSLGDFKPGAEMTIKLGYSKKLETVFVGYITSVDLDIDAGRRVIILVRGMDAKIWMMSNQKSETKKGVKKYSAAVRNVYNDYAGKFSGSSINISGEPELSLPIDQISESDYMFVCRMAYLAGALFFIDNGKLNFIDMYPKVSSNNILPRYNISNIKTSVNLCGIPDKVKVVAQNKKNFKKTIEGTALDSQKMGKGEDASGLSKNVNGVVTLVRNNISSTAEADFASKVEQNRRNFNLVTAKVDLINGIPSLKISETYTIKDVGKSIDNEYMLLGVKHFMSGGRFTSTMELGSTRYVKPGGLF